MELDKLNLKKAEMRLKAAAHPVRLSIIKFIDKAREIPVNKIYQDLELEQSFTSQHLRILRDAGLVITRRNGKFIYYRLDYKRLANLSAQVEEMCRKDSDQKVGNTFIKSASNIE